jgi:hypothetical protein
MYRLGYEDKTKGCEPFMMCEKLGQSVAAQINNEVWDNAMPKENAQVMGWACDRTDCPSYGKWYCPFSW